ncbi:MAG: hypothetical protein EB141_01755 [Verrucomicrobia bacterium]|nr:hypothetical protein [Verrucomicrobiota bacterium]NBU07597.1 hypothetical protein [Pseudomonadota bacterium]NDA65581.1 hypothetical protein [Verrucomicrobiota bacterium]NDB74369.1 hypothetical protein [Verrucomicrobiota bacterium]NDD36851.1 hypothetical protein [Verrucomicrobiota bacterium]
MADDFENPTPSYSAARKFGTGFNTLVGVAAFVAIVLMVNFLAARHYRRVSISEDRVPPLAAVSLQVVHAFTNDLNVTVFFDPEEVLYGPILQLLRQYEHASPRVKVSVVNYLTEPAKAEQVKKRCELPPNTRDVIIFEMNGKHRIVRAGELSEYDTSNLLAGKSQTVKRKSFNGEAYFTSAMLTLFESRQLNAYYLVGHKEHEPDSPTTPTGYWKFIQLLEQANGMRAYTLPLVGTNEVPADCSLLVIAGPVLPVTPTEREKLNRYLDRGGRALILLTQGSSPDLERLLEQWGVELGDNFVTDEAGDRADSHMTLKNFGEHEIVRLFGGTQNGVIFPTARSVRPRPGVQGSDAPQARPLVSTSEAGKAISNYRNGPRYDPRRDPPPGVVPVAVAVERGGLRSVEGGSTRMVVVGDSFFLNNQVIEASINRDFAHNAINWLVDRPRLVGVGPRPVRVYQFSMSDSQLRSVQWILLGGVPGVILGFGLLVWFRRQS